MPQTVLYHRTTIAKGSEAVRNGFQDELWSFGLRDTSGEEAKFTGVWLTDRPLEPFKGPPGDALLEVVVDLSEDALQAFEVDNVFFDTRLWVIPAELLNPHATTMIKEVDPNTSWQFDAGADDSFDPQ